MDAEDETTGYLKFLNDGPQGYLLHSSEDGLTDAFPGESIFTEITSDWSSEGFPILLSGPLIAEDNDEESVSNTVQLLSEDNESNTLNDDSNSNTVTFYSSVEVPERNNSLLLSNDLLLQLESEVEDDVDHDNQQEEFNGLPSNTITQVINGTTYSITYTQSPSDGVNEEFVNVLTNEDSAKDSETQLIQLLNVDGTITNIDKRVLNIFQSQSSDSGEENNLQSYYSEVKALKCKVCSFLCESVDEVTGHINTAHLKEVCPNVAVTNGKVINDGDSTGPKMKSILNLNRDKKYTMFLCSECGSGYSSKDDLKQHMISQHDLIYLTNTANEISAVIQSEAKTDKSKTTDGDKAKLTSRSHSTSLLKKQQKAMKKVKCSVKGCPLKFAKDELRIRHEDCHVNQEKKQFMCPVCKEKFSVWRICNMHLWKCHSIDLGLLTCPMCNKFKSNSLVRVLNHMGIHNDEKPFVCATCGKSFKQVNQLRNHEVSHRPPENVPDWFSVKQCEFCDRYFADSKCLKKHIKFVHDKFKPFICNICGHQTTRKAMLQLHHRQHTGDKPHHCTYCNYKTGDHNCLRKHMMIHFGVTKYSCPYCSYQSIQTSAYKVHMTKKHPGKEGTYSCTTCTYTTVNVASYLSHVKCHELEKRTKKVNDNVTDVAEKTTEKPDGAKEGETKTNDKEGSNAQEDDETQNCFLNTEHTEETVDTGGITIPAGFDMQIDS